MATPILSIGDYISDSQRGLIGDIMTTMALGARPLSVPTQIDSDPLPLKLIETQLDKCLQKTPTAIKVGIISEAETVELVGQKLSLLPPTVHKVVNLISTNNNGQAVLKEETIEAYRESLFPYTSLLVVNVQDAEFLTNVEIQNVMMLQKAAQLFFDRHNIQILVTGGYLSGTEQHDVLVGPQGLKLLNLSRSLKHQQNSMEFTGSAHLSTGITAALGLGMTTMQAVNLGRQFIEEAINSERVDNKERVFVDLACTIRSFNPKKGHNPYTLVS